MTSVKNPPMSDAEWTLKHPPGSLVRYKPEHVDTVHRVLSGAFMTTGGTMMVLVEGRRNAVPAIDCVPFK